jgi:hypothetical protein
MVIGIILISITCKTMNMVRDLTKETAPENWSETVSVSVTTPTPTGTSIPTTTVSKPTEPTRATVGEDTIPTVNQRDVELLACVIYQEAGADAQCDDCRRRVADVVLNRVASEHFPDTIYEVLTQKNQYGRFYYTGVKWPERASYDSEKHAVARAYRIAEEVLRGNHSELYGKDYIWQAEFVQGTSGFWCCGIYFGK